jgi:hypothetical protein
VKFIDAAIVVGAAVSTVVGTVSSIVLGAVASGGAVPVAVVSDAADPQATNPNITSGNTRVKATTASDRSSTW